MQGKHWEISQQLTINNSQSYSEVLHVNRTMGSFLVLPETESYSDSMSGDACLFITSRGISEIKICSKILRWSSFKRFY